MGTGAPLHLDQLETMFVKQQIQTAFPNIQHRFELTSERTEEYNCIAWAANDEERWWWPTNPDRYWPEDVGRAETLESFIGAFATIGYQPCVNGDLEKGIEKVAIYSVGGIPKHMARQLRSGVWTSKLGEEWDISHDTVDGVTGSIYGAPAQFLAREFVQIMPGANNH